jgi:hypothetical protein
MSNSARKDSAWEWVGMLFWCVGVLFVLYSMAIAALIGFYWLKTGHQYEFAANALFSAAAARDLPGLLIYAVPQGIFTDTSMAKWLEAPRDWLGLHAVLQWLLGWSYPIFFMALGFVSVATGVAAMAYFEKR